MWVCSSESNDALRLILTNCTPHWLCHKKFYFLCNSKCHLGDISISSRTSKKVSPGNINLSLVKLAHLPNMCNIDSSSAASASLKLERYVVSVAKSSVIFLTWFYSHLASYLFFSLRKRSSVPCHVSVLDWSFQYLQLTLKTVTACLIYCFIS